MLNLGDVLELIDNAFYNRSFSQQDAIIQCHRSAVPRIRPQSGQQLHTEGVEHKFVKLFRYIAFIAKELTKQFADQFRNGFAIIDVARGEQNIQQFTAVIDHQMQFEAKKLAGGGLASSGQASKYFVRGDALVQADSGGHTPQKPCHHWPGRNCATWPGAARCS
jgi:hypothetical protein